MCRNNLTISIFTLLQVALTLTKLWFIKSNITLFHKMFTVFRFPKNMERNERDLMTGVLLRLLSLNILETYVYITIKDKL